MIILEKPYASEYLIDSIVRNDWVVLENKAVELAAIEDGAFETISEEIAQNYYNKLDYPLIYSNSENAINWILEKLPDSQLARYISLFKNKTAFRNMLKDFYPEFQYKEYDFETLSSLPVESLKFPIVIKPTIGFLSFGVHTIHNDKDWKTSLFALEKEMQVAQNLYPQTVIDGSKFLIEDYADGEEYAIDAYYDREGNPVILNIFQHPFLDSNDVRDRIYITSAGIMIKYMSKFAMILKQIGEKNDIRNFPLHIEVRVTSNEEIIPIEVNPMRFAGWCTTDLAQYAWGINPYECFMGQKKPDWTEILEKASKGVYYFSMAEISSDVDRSKIKSFDYESYLKNFSNVLELRRINYKKNPLFAIIFGQTNDKEEVKNILQLKPLEYGTFAQD